MIGGLTPGMFQCLMPANLISGLDIQIRVGENPERAEPEDEEFFIVTLFQDQKMQFVPMETPDGQKHSISNPISTV